MTGVKCEFLQNFLPEASERCKSEAIFSLKMLITHTQLPTLHSIWTRLLPNTPGETSTCRKRIILPQSLSLLPVPVSPIQKAAWDHEEDYYCVDYCNEINFCIGFQTEYWCPASLTKVCLSSMCCLNSWFGHRDRVIILVLITTTMAINNNNIISILTEVTNTITVTW